ncbi:uncharacterized protein PFL1_02172 [Pseudozyma flocculosa PF-1]|uniref:Related to Ribonuclease Z / related to thiamin pyrophosphokinase 1 n=1 Tax=Pseudozyma flocculosa TaxID=84751 RepID=A0A5C3FB92_9BASI|nr:uncharacterized protein PFL1_02172 [Pseudozyma flocculosa PF-1]EPQ30055.1 hypothetical protein PFL1_02172 [Pseudozyma flocculosa PF-1]SPO41396.1 related to Ribonuclease Z / related to thiamin pyrophosphokinase 1 [Pseudozyma flocculosa]
MAPPRISLKFLGTSSMPNATRNYSSLLVKVDNHTVMVDCGESTQRQFQARYIGGDEKMANLKTILVTHLHADHVLGIVPLLMSMMGPSGTAASASDAPRVEIFGPRGLRALIRTTLTLCYSKLSGKYVVHELTWPRPDTHTSASGGSIPTSLLDEPDRPIPALPPHESELPGRDIPMELGPAAWTRFTSFKAHGQCPRVHISAAPITHRCPTLGYTFEEEWATSPLDAAVPELLKANAQALLDERNIRNPLSLLPRLTQQRESILLPDGTMLHPPPLDLPGRKVTVLGDTSDATGGLLDGLAGTEAKARGMAALARGSDVLVHESTNIALPAALTRDGKAESRPQAMVKAAERGHSTPQGAGAFAALVRAGCLILNHFSVRYPAPPHYLLGKQIGGPNDDGASTTASGTERNGSGPGGAGPGAASKQGPRQLGEPERRSLVMREFESQAAESWRAAAAAGEGGSGGAMTTDADVQPGFEVKAAYDGFVYDVPPRPRVASRHVPFSRPGETWHADPPHPAAFSTASYARRSSKKASARAVVATTPAAAKYQSRDGDWDPSPYLLDDVTRREAHAVVLLNSPIGDVQKRHLVRIWETAKYRLCADGAANRLVEAFGYDCFVKGTRDQMPLPHAIVGDLDSVRPEVKSFFAEQGVEILLRPSQYATDLQKCIQAVEDHEASAAGDGARSSELVLLIFGGLSGRFDQSVHTLHVLWQLAPGAADLGGVEDPSETEAAASDGRGGKLRKRRRTYVVGDGSMAWLLSPGKHRLRMSRAVMGKTCGLLPLGVGNAGARISTKGLEWDLEGEPPSTLGGFLSTSNHLAHPDGEVEVETDQPVYWTVELKQQAGVLEEEE